MTPTPKPAHPLSDRGVIIALISLAGTIVVAYLSYVNTRMQVEAPIRATQTAESKATAFSLATASAFRPSATATATIATFTMTAAPRPLFTDFVVCPVRCNGFNGVHTFPEKTQEIHAQWRYRYVAAGAEYERTWSLGTEVWVRYACIWKGPSEGVENISMTEGRGFRSGTWTVTIRVNRETVMQETVVVQGNWDYWYPPGEFDYCPGQK